MTKHCKTCGQVKPLSEFYRHARMKDGHLNKCISCCREYDHARRSGKKKTRSRQATLHLRQLAALLHLAQQNGKVDVTACMKAVRDAVRDGVDMRW